MTVIAPNPDVLSEEMLLRKRTPLHFALNFCRRKPLGAFGLAIVLVFIAAGIFADWIAPFDPEENDFNAMMQAPSFLHLFGTDQFGRDIFSRLVFGARTAMLVGFGSAVGGGLIGLVLGVASAYFGGWFDLVFQRVLDVLMAFPLIILALAVVSVFGTGVFNVMIAITIPLVPAAPGVVRARARWPRSALCRCRPRAGLRPCPYHPAPHGAQRRGAVPGSPSASSARRSRRRPIVSSRARRAGSRWPRGA
jgi:peptide/nickel transport system permease protein